MEGLPDWFQYGDEPAFPASPANQYERLPQAQHAMQHGGKGDGSHSPGYNMLVGTASVPHTVPLPHNPASLDGFYSQQGVATGTVIRGPGAAPTQPVMVQNMPHPYPVLSKNTEAPPGMQAPAATPVTPDSSVFRLIKHIDKLKSSLLVQGGLQQAFAIIEELRSEVLKLTEEGPAGMGKKDYCSSNSSKDVGGVTSSSSSEKQDKGKGKKNPGVVPTPRPCTHNNWDNVRARKGAVTLRCRTCQSQWRVLLQSARRCPHFDTGRCTKAEKCPKLHVYRSKQSLNERVQSFGDGVLQRVPLHARPSTQKEEEEVDKAADDKAPAPADSTGDQPAPADKTAGEEEEN